MSAGGLACSVGLFGLWLALLPACATAAGSGESAEAAARAEVARLISSKEVPGLQYEVVGAEGVLFAAAAGVRDVVSAAPMEEATLQMAYSTTKVITSIAILQLAERGRMELDAPLARYFPEHPYGDGVSIRQLLAHTSGVPDPMPLDWFAVDGRPFDRDEQLRRQLARHPKLRHPPGQRYGYSNLGYWLLEKAIERASGQDFAAYVDEHVFGPLGLTTEAARWEPDGPGDLAVGHGPRFSAVTWALKLMTPSNYWAGAEGRWTRSARVLPHGRAYGGLLVSAHALGRVLRELLTPDGVLLSPASKAALFDAQGAAAGGLGWVRGEVEGEPYFGKQGGGLGFHANLRIYPARGIATVFLANRTEITARPIDRRSDQLDAAFLRFGSPARASLSAQPAVGKPDTAGGVRMHDPVIPLPESSS